MDSCRLPRSPCDIHLSRNSSNCFLTFPTSPQRRCHKHSRSGFSVHTVARPPNRSISLARAVGTLNRAAGFAVRLPASAQAEIAQHRARGAQSPGAGYRVSSADQALPRCPRGALVTRRRRFAPSPIVAGRSIAARGVTARDIAAPMVLRPKVGPRNDRGHQQCPVSRQHQDQHRHRNYANACEEKADEESQVRPTAEGR